jgi:tetratricopeptide (TPR) repeat protein
MGEPPGSDRPARALASLAAAPALLVLDNLETPWEAPGQGAATSAALEQLAAVPALRLLASIRGSERPGRVRWRRPDDLAPLDEADATALFLAVTEGEGAVDPALPGLLALLGGLPLAIDLVARRLEEAGSVERLRADWQRQRTRAASIGSGDDRELSLHASIELSLASPRLTTAGHRLFAMMGHLPDGLAEPDAEALLGPEGATAATGLRRVGLARLEGGRLRMLVPVREHAGSSTPLDPDDTIRLRDHFLGLARAMRAYFHGLDRSLDLPRHRIELTNIEAVLDRALEHCDPANSSFRHEVGYLTIAAGDMRREIGQLSLALRAHDRARAIYGNLVADDRSNSTWARYLSVSWERLGDVRQAQGDLAGALAAYEAYHPIAERLAASDPVNAEWQRDLIVSHWRIAAVLEELPERRGEAAAHLGKALAVARELTGSGRLAPPDAYIVEELEQRLAAAEGREAGG